ncbi:MAG: OB-fold domain-containing protein [Thermoplasmata archaeon]
MSADAKPRRALPVPATAPAEATSRPSPKPPKPASEEKRPFLLDFFPLEGPESTRLSRFYDRLREGRLSTVRCPKDHELLWPPRTACPKCHSEELVWVDLPERGRIYAFSAVLGGAPLGMEGDVPFAVGLVDLDGVPLRLFGRIVGRTWQELQIGETVRVESFEIADRRVFYRFRAGD